MVRFANLGKIETIAYGIIQLPMNIFVSGKTPPNYRGMMCSRVSVIVYFPLGEF